MQNQIKSLLYSGNSINVELVLTLIESKEIDFDLNPYREIIAWLATFMHYPPEYSFIAQLSEGLETDHLGLNRKGIESLPNGIGLLENLETLGLSVNQLTELPDSICNLSKLERLDAYENRLRFLPPNFGDLINLQTLDLFHNEIRSLPKSFNKLVNLTELDLSLNLFDRLPIELTNLKNLKILKMEGIKLSISERVFLRGCLPNCKIYF